MVRRRGGGVWGVRLWGADGQGTIRVLVVGLAFGRRVGVLVVGGDGR